MKKKIKNGTMIINDHQFKKLYIFVSSISIMVFVMIISILATVLLSVNSRSSEEINYDIKKTAQIDVMDFLTIDDSETKLKIVDNQIKIEYLYVYKTASISENRLTLGPDDRTVKLVDSNMTISEYEKLNKELKINEYRKKLIIFDIIIFLLIVSTVIFFLI